MKQENNNKLYSDYSKFDNYNNLYDCFMTIPRKSEFDANVSYQVASFETFQRLVFNCILKKDIFMHYFDNIKKNNAYEHPEVNSASTPSTHALFRIGTDERVYNDKGGAAFLQDNFYQMFVEYICESLTNLCSCDVRLIDLEQRYSALTDQKYLLKIRIAKDSLLNLASQSETLLNLNYEEVYLNFINHQYCSSSEVNSTSSNSNTDIKQTNDYNNSNSLTKTKTADKYKELSIYDIVYENNKKSKVSNIIDDVNKLNVYVGYDDDDSDKNNSGYENFLYKNAFPTYSDVDIRFNPKKVGSIYMTYPWYENPVVNQIKQIANIDLDYGIKRSCCDIYTDINVYMTSAYGFRFGICPDTSNKDYKEKDKEIKVDDQVKVFPQDVRIDLTSDCIQNSLNLRFFQNCGLISDYDGLHYYPDKRILENSIAQVTESSRLLSDLDLFLVKHYWGSEVAFYFLFVNALTKVLTYLAVLSVVVQVAIYTSSYLYPTIWVVPLQIVFSVMLILFVSIFLYKWNLRERKFRKIWGGGDSFEISEWDMTKITTFEGPYYWDVLRGNYEQKSNRKNYWRLISWVTIVLLLGSMTVIVSILIEYKFEATTAGRDTEATMWGLLVSITIKVYQMIWMPLSQFYSTKENYRYLKTFNNTMALKTFIFNYFNLFYNFFYIAFIKRITGKTCITKTVKVFDGQTFEYESCMYELSNQLLINSVVFLFLNFVELGLPFLMKRISKHEAKPYSSLTMDVPSAQMETQTDDYMEIILQMSMCLTFGISFPFALFLFFVMNYLEIRVDLVKYIKYSKRGECRSDGGIGVWFNIVEIIGIMCIATNIIFICQELYIINNTFIDNTAINPNGDDILNGLFGNKKLDPAVMIYIFIGVQYFFLLFKYMIHWIVPDNSFDIDIMNVLDQQVKDNLRYKSMDSVENTDTSDDIILRQVLPKVNGTLIKTHFEFEGEGDIEELEISNGNRDLNKTIDSTKHGVYRNNQILNEVDLHEEEIK